MRALTAMVLALAGCGGAGMFSIGGVDSTEAELSAVAAAQPGPTAVAQAVAVVAVGGEKPAIVAVELESSKERWRVPGTAASRIVVAGDTVTYSDGSAIQVRSLADGSFLWQQPLSGTLVGLATDGEGIYTVGERDGLYTVEAYSRSGSPRWSKETEATLGAPSARAGQLFVPLLEQWLLVLDGRSGARLGRLRGIEHRVGFVDSRWNGVFFGSKAGVFALDRSAAEAREAQSSFAKAVVPDEFSLAQYHFDGYDPVQTAYTAYDKNHRLLWAWDRSTRGFADGAVVYHAYRYLFSLDHKTGALRWAYSHPGADLVSSHQSGKVIACASSTGQIVIIDSTSGRVLHRASVAGPVLGATFEIGGWAAKNTVDQPAPNAINVLAKIARDKEDRFARIKRYALRTLAERGGGRAVTDLVAVVTAPDIRPELFETAAASLISLEDANNLPVLLAALEGHYSYVDHTEVRAVGVLARAIAAIDPKTVPEAQRAVVRATLLRHFKDPATAAGDLIDIARALTVYGDGSERVAFRELVVHHRADRVAVGEVPTLVHLLKLLAKASAADRAFVMFVANDPATTPQLAENARKALADARLNRGSALP